MVSSICCGTESLWCGPVSAVDALTYGRLTPYARPALVNGVAGVVVARDGRPLSIMAFNVVEGRITAIDVLADPDRLRRLDLTPVL